MPHVDPAGPGPHLQGSLTPLFDVAVVGAGPAGSTCAVALAAQGVERIALIDRERFPRDKSCGDGLGPGAVRVAEQLGMREVFDGFDPVERLAVSGPSNRHVSGPLPLIGNARPKGFVIPRKIFDNRLFAAAVSRGATDLTGLALKDATFDVAEDVWTLSLQGDDGLPHTLKARVLIGADGARSRVRKILGVPFNSDAHTGTAVRIYAKSLNNVESALRLDFVTDLLPAYGWIFPISQERANVGVGIDVLRYKRLGTPLKELLQRYQKDIGGASRFAYEEGTQQTYILPYGSELPRLSFAGKRAALIGDAGSMINPFTGEGIFYGMYAGMIVGEYLGEAVVKKTCAPYEALRRFEKQFRERFVEHYNLNAWMKEKTADPRYCEIVIRACERDEVVLADLIDLMMGDRRNLSGSTLFRIFWSGLLMGR